MAALGLLRSRRFLPLFLTQLLGALNDNLFKNALVLLVTFRAAGSAAQAGGGFAALAGGAFILPFFLFSATAGQLADHLDKARMIRWIKSVELLCTVPFALALYSSDGPVLLAAIFVAGTFATFFGPLKYSILPQHLAESELSTGNALIEAATFLAILTGTIGAGAAISLQTGELVCAGGLLTIAAAGFAASLAIPAAPPSAGLDFVKLRLNIFADTAELIGEVRRDRNLFLVLLGVSWFWFLGATFLAEMPALVRDTLGGEPAVCTLLLAAFALGIGAGSIACARTMAGRVHAKPVPLAAIALSVTGIDFYLALSAAHATGAVPIGVAAFLSTFSGWRILIDLAALAAAGGFFCVPLYSLMQSLPEPGARARVVAACNVLNAAFMVASAGMTVALLALGRSIPWILLAASLANLVVAAYAVLLLPDALLKHLLAASFRLVFRSRVHGLENYPAAGQKALIVPTHQSLIDAALLAALLPGRPTFAVNTAFAKRWWVRPLLRLVDAFPVDPSNPLGMKALIKVVDQGRHTVIFPEGRITVTGALMKIYDGPGMIADKTGAVLVPVRIDGAQYSLLSYLKGKVRRRLFPKIDVAILPPRRLEIPAALRGRNRRRAAGVFLEDLMTTLVFETSPIDATLYEALLDARAVHGRSTVIVEDPSPQRLSYGRLIALSLALGRRLAQRTVRGERVGVLLPNSVAAAAVFWALQGCGRVVSLLNFSTGTKGMLAAKTAAELKTIIASRRFVELAKLQEAVEALEAAGADVLWIEDLRARMGLVDKLYALAARPFARLIHRRARARPDEPAVVLFTSGSEGVPKGVVLSHRNLLANRHQLAAIIDFNPTDVVFNAMPIFHSFGLTGGMLLPMLAGVKTFLYPSPLHYRVVPELVYAANATIMFGADTFLAGYAKAAHPYDFRSIRYVFAGAMKVREATHKAVFDKFGLRIYEGYGATECSPVVAVNTPMHYRAGTVGRIIPGLAFRLDPIAGLARGGRLFVNGPNVMLGYLRVDRPGIIDPPADGWYDTGDIVSIDDDGYVTIFDRAKRIAKPGGEMVSLAAVEELAERTWPGLSAAAVALPDPKKGEQVVLVAQGKDGLVPARDEILAQARKEGVPELFVPRSVLAVKALPLLGTGKADFVAVKAMAEALLARAPERVLDEEALDATPESA